MNVIQCEEVRQTLLFNQVMSSQTKSRCSKIPSRVTAADFPRVHLTSNVKSNTYSISVQLAVKQTPDLVFHELGAFSSNNVVT